MIQDQALSQVDFITDMLLISIVVFTGYSLGLKPKIVTNHMNVFLGISSLLALKTTGDQIGEHPLLHTSGYVEDHHRFDQTYQEY